MTHPASRPAIDLIPLQAALCKDHPVDLTVLARILPVKLESEGGGRPPLNLSLVIDRSGSMQGRPLEMARQAAQTAIRAMGQQDRVSVVAFDSTVETIIPSQFVEEPERLCREVERITDQGMTALHAGWHQGATLVAEHVNLTSLNRVLLLSDGQANRGITDLSTITQHVQGLNQHGVSTSTIGLGRDYNEVLMQGMANAGDGNYEHIEDPETLPAYFADELQGLTRTSGHTVSCGIEPNLELGITGSGILNDLNQNEYGRSLLPNLIADRPIDILFRLHSPALPQLERTGVTRLRLAWTDRQGVRHVHRVQLDLPVVTAAEFAALQKNEDVLAALYLLENAQAKREMVDLIDAGDVQGARRRMEDQVIRYCAAPPAVQNRTSHVRELSELQELATNVERDAVLTRKRAYSQHYNRSRSKQ